MAGPSDFAFVSGLAFFFVSPVTCRLCRKSSGNEEKHSEMIFFPANGVDAQLLKELAEEKELLKRWKNECLPWRMACDNVANIDKVALAVATFKDMIHEVETQVKDGEGLFGRNGWRHGHVHDDGLCQPVPWSIFQKGLGPLQRQK